MKIYILGNDTFEDDSLPIRLLDDLRAKYSSSGVEFIEIDPSEDDFPDSASELVIIDTVINARGVVVLGYADIEKIEKSANYSVHDFDLGTMLKVMKKLGRLGSVRIIGVAPESENWSRSEALTSVCGEVDKLLVKR